MAGDRVPPPNREKPLPPPPLPPRSFIDSSSRPGQSSQPVPESPTSSSVYHDDNIKDPHFLTFLNAGPSLPALSVPVERVYDASDLATVSPMDAASPPYSASMATSLSTPFTASPISPMTSSPCGGPSVDDIARLKRAESGLDSVAYSVTSMDSAPPSPTNTRARSGSRRPLDVIPMIETNAVPDDEGHIQVDIDVKQPAQQGLHDWAQRMALGGHSRGSSSSAASEADSPPVYAGDGVGPESGSGRLNPPLAGFWGRRASEGDASSSAARSDTLAARSEADETEDLDVEGPEVITVGGKLRKASRKQKAQAKARGKERVKSLAEPQVLPPMNIVIFIVGSRGDVQPYLALALSLIISAGHRVRIATHPDFRTFVLTANSRLKGKFHNGVPLGGRLEYFDAGGDPKELMAYMVKNPGLMPGFESLTNGDIKRKRQMSADMLRGFYRSTFSPDVVSGRDFAADAIISNPPAFAHIHVAEALGIPLLMSFTMPWTATVAFPHPLVNVRSTNADKYFTNWMGYHLADTLMWEGLGETINTFRTTILRLNELPDRVASGVIDNLQIPWTYCWSPELLSKPRDWKDHVDISGFYFLDGEDDYLPPADLAAFLEAGEPPVYIGFGSVVIPDPEKATDIIFQAVAREGIRAIVSAGWAGLGKGREGESENVFILTADCPHEWLFAENRVRAVCHHGGAGTTACGLRHGRPTIICPFFGDQKFWGDAVHNAGAGPAPLPFKQMTVDTLADALAVAVGEEVASAAGRLGEKIRAEKGEEKGGESFNRHMPVHNMTCQVDPRRVAAWWCPRYCLRLSIEAAAALLAANKIMTTDLEPYRCVEYDTSAHAWGPTGAAFSSLGHTLGTAVSGVGQLFYSPIRGTKQVFYGIPEASLAVIGDLYRGFENTSSKIGSTPRPKGKVTDWKSGFAVGGKACAWSIWDGVLGIFVEPVDGAMREGWAGLGKGFGRGMVNAVVRPSAGMLALFVEPTRGIQASVRASVSGVSSTEPQNILRAPKESLTREAISTLSREEQEKMLRTFSRLEEETSSRKKKRESTRWILIATKEERERERALRHRMRKEKNERTLSRKTVKDAKKAADKLAKDEAETRAFEEGMVKARMLKQEEEAIWSVAAMEVADQQAVTPTVTPATAGESSGSSPISPSSVAALEPNFGALSLAPEAQPEGGSSSRRSSIFSRRKSRG